MNNDLISRSELRKAINDFYDNHFKGLVPNELITYAEAVDNFIDEAPTVELLIARGSARCEIIIPLTRQVGEWVFHKDYNESCRYGCNQCGKLSNIQGNFCPNCGAYMKKRSLGDLWRKENE